MPDILIRGMRKPTSCDDCPMYTCMHNFDDCPLHELPSHGDLIEAEPIKRFITDGLNRKEFGYDQIKVLTEVEYAPVIVPASEEVSNGDEH